MTKLFAFRVPHCAAAEQWLNMQADDGWALEKITVLSFARFTRSETLRQYAVRIGPVPSWANKDEYEEYRNFFAPFGWTHIAALRQMHIFEADKEHEPIVSDVEAEVIEYARYYKHTLNRTLGMLAALLFFILVGFFQMSAIVFLIRPFYLAVLALVIITAVLCLIYALRYWRYKTRSKLAIENGSPLPALSLKAARCAGIMGIACGILLYAIWISIAIWDASLSPLHNNIIITFGPLAGALIGNLSYRKWGFEKRGLWKSMPIIAGTLIFLGAFVYFFMPPPEDMSISDTNGLPVLHMPGAVDEYNYYYHTATPLMSQYEYTEFPGDRTYYGSLCVDSATYALADIAFKEVAYNVDFAGFPRREEDFEPFDFAGADSAMINRQAAILVFRQKKRVVCVKWRYGFDMLSDIKYFDRVREVFFE